MKMMSRESEDRAKITLRNLGQQNQQVRYIYHIHVIPAMVLLVPALVAV
jgi:hypothetical protein